MEINELINTVSTLEEKHLSKAEKVTVLKVGLEFFLKHFGHLTFAYTDMRGGDETPTIILKTSDKFDLEEICTTNNIVAKFKSHDYYNKFRNNLFTFGFYKHVGNDNEDENFSLTYFYLGCNTSLLSCKDLSEKNIKETLLSRSNREVFPHIDMYFK